MCLSRNKKVNVYPCKPQFYYIEVGFKGVEIIYVCFRGAGEVALNTSLSIFFFFFFFFVEKWQKKKKKKKKKKWLI